MMRPLLFVLSSCVISALLIANSYAQQPAAPAAPSATETPTAVVTPAPAVPAAPVVGNKEAGRSLAYTCQGCHGISGYKNAYPSYHVPKIGGQSAEYLMQALHEYQKGSRKHPTMQAQAQSFSDQDIANLAAFLSSVDK